MKVKTLNDLFVHELKDLHNAEKQMTKALPTLIQAATHPDLKVALEEHLKQTEEHVTRVERICEMYDIKPGGSKCRAMEGLIEEGKHTLADMEDDDVRDAAIIASAQRIEHYEMAGYGCARTFAQMLGFEEAARLLQATLDEEQAADRLLTQVAMRNVNADAIA